MISQETMNSLIKYFQDYPELKGIPASSEEIKHAENILRIKFHDDYIEFIKKFGGASAGLDIHAFHNSTLIGKETRFLQTGCKICFNMVKSDFNNSTV